MKQTKKTDNKKATLTDAELQQVTGAGSSTTEIKYKQTEECKAQSDKANCEKLDYCQWYKGKDGYHCTWCSPYYK